MTTTPKRIIQKKLLSELIPCAENNKIHTPKSIGVIADSINKFGYTTLIEVDENNEILSGHGRYFALLELGREEAEVQIIKGFSDKEKMQYRIEHNMSSEVAEYNIEILTAHIEKIGDPKFEELCKPVIEELTIPKFVEDQKDHNIQNKEIDPNGLFEDGMTVQCPKCKFQFLPPERDNEDDL